MHLCFKFIFKFIFVKRDNNKQSHCEVKSDVLTDLCPADCLALAFYQLSCANVLLNNLFVRNHIFSCLSSKSHLGLQLMTVVLFSSAAFVSSA